jgi:hypothetical protein
MEPQKAPSDEAQAPRKKRVKIPSACSECRRKKTKCNGEQPCRNCQKVSSSSSSAVINCVYPSATSSSATTAAEKNQKLSIALEVIENRLKKIEDMLNILLAQQQQIKDVQDITNNRRLPPIHNLSSPVSIPVPQQQQQQQQHNDDIPEPIIPQHHLYHNTQLPPSLDSNYHSFILNKKRKR